MSKAKALVMAALAVLATAYNYDRCDPVNGPVVGWAALGQCSGLEQSPINLCGAVPVPGARGVAPGGGIIDAPPVPGANYTITAFNYKLRRNMTLQNMGHTLQMFPSAGNVAATLPFLRIPALHMLVGRSELDSNVTADWEFAQMHVHFGREGNANEGSEHALDGRRYPAELHLVHFNKGRGLTLAEAVATGAKDAVLVIGVFLELGLTETQLVTNLAVNGPTLLPPPTNTPLDLLLPLRLSDVFNAGDNFYSYAGSLTTPGCNEQVTWVVMRTPKYITADSFELLKRTMETPIELIAFFGNYRPLQPLNARAIYSSVNLSSTCQLLPVAEPCTICATGAVIFNSKTNEQASESASGSSAYAWIVVGVVVPVVVMAAAGVAFYYRGSWRRMEEGQDTLVFTPIEQQRNMVPNTNDEILEVK